MGASIRAPHNVGVDRRVIADALCAPRRFFAAPVAVFPTQPCFWCLSLSINDLPGRSCTMLFSSSPPSPLLSKV
jgi:hypothetical protein